MLFKKALLSTSMIAILATTATSSEQDFNDSHLAPIGREGASRLNGNIDYEQALAAALAESMVQDDSHGSPRSNLANRQIREAQDLEFEDAQRRDLIQEKIIALNGQLAPVRENHQDLTSQLEQIQAEESALRAIIESHNVELTSPALQGNNLGTVQQRRKEFLVAEDTRIAAQLEDLRKRREVLQTEVFLVGQDIDRFEGQIRHYQQDLEGLHNLDQAVLENSSTSANPPATATEMDEATLRLIQQLEAENVQPHDHFPTDSTAVQHEDDMDEATRRLIERIQAEEDGVVHQLGAPQIQASNHNAQETLQSDETLARLMLENERMQAEMERMRVQLEEAEATRLQNLHLISHADQEAARMLNDAEQLAEENHFLRHALNDAENALQAAHQFQFEEEDNSATVVTGATDGQMTLLFEQGSQTHYVPCAIINGQNRVESNMVYDTGASMTCIPAQMCEQLGIDLGALQSNAQTHVQTGTANGQAVGYRTVLPQLQVGTLGTLNNLEVIILPNLENPLFGRNAIRQFNSQSNADEITLMNRN